MEIAGKYLYFSFPPLLAISPRQPNRIYVGLPSDSTASGAGGDAVYVTSDGGQTWTRSKGLLRDEGPHQVVADPTAPVIAYLATSNGIRRTTDGGLTWHVWQGGAVTPQTDVYCMIGAEMR